MEAEAYFKKSLQSLRRAAGLSQKELAHRAGCSSETISVLERGISLPGYAMLLSLADALAVPPRALVPPSTDGTIERAELLARIELVLSNLPDDRLSIAAQQIVALKNGR